MATTIAASACSHTRASSLRSVAQPPPGAEHHDDGGHHGQRVHYETGPPKVTGGADVRSVSGSVPA